MYMTASSNKEGYRKFWCRRKNLQPGFGHHDCTSTFSITQTFSTMLLHECTQNDKRDICITVFKMATPII